MNRDIHSQAEQLNKKHRRKRTWYKILSVPICLVVFVTTYALILPAITMESTPDTYCGITEHVHTDDCYEIPATPAHKEIRCAAGADPGEGEYIVHRHDGFCFDDSGELMCTLPEQDEHVHTDDCYDGDSLACGLVTGIAHQHTADCVVSVPATEPQGLVCTVEEHKHTEACFIDPEGDTKSGAPSGETPTNDTPTGDMPADETPTGDTPVDGDPAGDTPTNDTPAGDVPADAEQNGGAPGDAVQGDDAANSDTPAENAAANGTPAKAPAASGQISRVTLTINDKVSGTGCYEVEVTGGSAALEGQNYRFLWYKSIDNGATYTAVRPQNFSVGGNTVSNISGDHGERLFLALDGGTVSDSLPSVTYKAVLKVDGTEYTDVSATLTNTTYQASVLNGSFEAPDLTDHAYQEFVPEGTTGLFWKTTGENTEKDQHVYGGSATVANDKKHYIEIVDTSDGDHKTHATNWHKQGTASHGKQYAEINAGAAGALYQTIATIPGTTMYWSVDHCGRDGTDTMAVVMMPESKAKNVTTQTQLLQVLVNPDNYGAKVVTSLTAAQGVWTTHSGQYTVPDGQYETRFFFMAVSTAGNNDYIGNHIDNVWFSQTVPPASSEKPYFTLTKNVVGPLTEDDLQLLSGKLTFAVQKSAAANFANPETVKTYTASALGSWTQNGDGSWTLSARISMKDQNIGDYYRIVESGAKLDGFDLTVTDNNIPVQLRNDTDTGFTFTNTYADAGRTLTLKKIVSAPDASGSFTFTVSYTDARGQAQEKTVTLKHGESTDITGIRKGSAVNVTETAADGYTVIMKNPDGTVLAGGSSYTFTMNDDAAIDVYNTSSVALPETGGIGREIFLFAGIGLMLTAVITGCLLRRKYGKEGD